MSRLDTLSSLWEAWTDQDLSASQWRLPTRLSPWDVRALYVHSAGWPHAFAYVVGRVSPEPATHSAADLLRQFNEPDGVAHANRSAVAAKATADAGQYTPEQMTAAFATVGPQAIEAARKLGDVVVDYLGMGRLRLDEVVSIGIVEATVHLLDLQRALGLEPTAPAGALEHTASVLTQIAAPVAFIEAVTGRGKGDIFPLMS